MMDSSIRIAVRLIFVVHGQPLVQLLPMLPIQILKEGILIALAAFISCHVIAPAADGGR